MTFDEFLAQYNGKTNVGNTTANKGQCVGLASVWIDILGGPHVWGDAKDMYANADPNFFEKIPNTPTGVPQKGDIVIWNGTFNRGPGHVAVATGKGDTKSFEVFEQNNPLGSNCHLRTYSNYNYVTGWLRPRHAVVEDTLPVKKSDFESLVLKSSEYDKFVAGGYSHLEDVQKTVQEKEKTIQNLTSDINHCETQVGKLLEDVQKVNEEDKNTSQELIDAQHALQPLRDELQAIRKELGIFEESSIIDAIKALKASKVKAAKKPVTLLDKILFILT